MIESKDSSWDEWFCFLVLWKKKNDSSHEAGEEAWEREEEKRPEILLFFTIIPLMHPPMHPPMHPSEAFLDSPELLEISPTI